MRELLERELDRRHVSHQAHSLSDELRAELRRRGLPVDRVNLRDLGHRLRQEYGNGVLSQRVLDRIAGDERDGAAAAVIVIDAIRNPAEVTTLREALSQAFELVAVVAPEDVLVERIRSRARAGDVYADDQARQMLAQEMGANEPDHGHNIAECIAMADLVVDNSGTLGDLERKVAEFVDARGLVRA